MGIKVLKVMLGCLTALPNHVQSLNSIMEYIFLLNTYHVLK